MEGPKLVNPFPKTADLTRKLFPWDGSQPVFARMPGSESLYLACFSTPEALTDFMQQAAIPYKSIKQIEDGTEFLTSFEEEHRKVMKVIIDPYYLPNGKVRFTELFWDSV